jgi:hypothetical protein
MDPHVLHPGHAPTPFTAAEIRDRCPAGRTMRLRVEPEEGEAYERRIRFVEVDEAGAVQEFTRLSASGDAVGDVVTHRSTWLDLQEHASYPAERASIEPDELELPFGRLACLRYTVDGDGDEVERFWFARSLPGMPVRYESVRGGRVVAATTMVANETGGD